MELLIAAAAAGLLAWSFPYWEPGRRTPNDTLYARALSITGSVAHLGGAVLAWLSGGPLAGVLAFLGIPLAASAIYSLLIAPVVRARRLRRAGPQVGIPPLRAARSR